MSPRLCPSRAVPLAAALLFALAAPAGAEIVATDWTLETADGASVTFHEELAQGPVVLSFWATWCRPCLKEMPRLDEMAGRYAGRVRFLAVNTDDTKAVAKVPPYLQAAGFANLVVPMDTGGKVQQIMQVGGILPFVALFDPQGREVYRHIGYKEGDEQELERAVADLLADLEAGRATDTGKPAWSEAVTATDRFEYSYSGQTRKEIFENWLDVSYQLGGFRTGIMLNSQAPSEEGDRANEIRHRFFEFSTGEFDIRAGHFYGIFGRGLIFNAYEDRTVRVDTRLDGITAAVRHGRLAATVFSGSPSARTLDIRAADAEIALPLGLQLGGTGMTWRPDDQIGDDGKVRREAVVGLRARQKLDFADWYVEYAWREAWDIVEVTDEPDREALYANVNLYRGPFSVSWEHSDYRHFTIVPEADGTTPLNRPPSLTRDFTWTLLNRAPHPMNQDDEKGHNLDLLWSGAGGWSVLGSLARLKRHDDVTVYELAYGTVQKDRLGAFRLQGGFAYQDKDGLRQSAVGEVTWFATDRRSLTLQAEHQHVRVGGYGAYDQDWFKLEYETAPTWAFAAILELNNKYEEQMADDEQPGPFPAGQVTYTLPRGGNLNLWFGKRQAGYLCSGGVCKFEPAFEGMELFGVFRY